MSEFKREDRYIVIKIKDLKDVPRKFRDELIDKIEHANHYMPEREYVCIESDWPEYEVVWQMIEDRINGNTRTLPAEVEQALAALDNLYDKAYRKLETNIDDIQQAGEALAACQQHRRK